jgi:hypothetical protein
MLSKEQARSLALGHILKSGGHDWDAVIIDENTIEREFGWVFFYQSRRFLETGCISDMLLGNAPIIINKSDGSLHVTGTAHPVDEYIDRYERSICT